MSEDYQLTIGSTYRAYLSEEDYVSGEFVGSAMIGTESAIVLKESSRVRFVLVAQILYIELRVSASTEPEHRSQPEHLYG